MDLLTGDMAKSLQLGTGGVRGHLGHLRVGGSSVHVKSGSFVHVRRWSSVHVTFV